MSGDVTKAIDAPMVVGFSSFGRFLRNQPAEQIETYQLSPNTHTLTVAEHSPCTHTFVAGGITGTTVPAPTAADIAAGLRAMIAAIEADRKARPVHAAITATHRAFRSDGRPHHYQDPLLDD